MSTEMSTFVALKTALLSLGQNHLLSNLSTMFMNVFRCNLLARVVLSQARALISKERKIRIFF